MESNFKLCSGRLDWYGTERQPVPGGGPGLSRRTHHPDRQHGAPLTACQTETHKVHHQCHFLANDLMHEIAAEVMKSQIFTMIQGFGSSLILTGSGSNK